jgi:hypothetical protein
LGASNPKPFLNTSRPTAQNNLLPLENLAAAHNPKFVAQLRPVVFCQRIASKTTLNLNSALCAFFFISSHPPFLVFS